MFNLVNLVDWTKACRTCQYHVYLSLLLYHSPQHAVLFAHLTSLRLYIKASRLIVLMPIKWAQRCLSKQHVALLRLFRHWTESLVATASADRRKTLFVGNWSLLKSFSNLNWGRWHTHSSKMKFVVVWKYAAISCFNPRIWETRRHALTERSSTVISLSADFGTQISDYNMLILGTLELLHFISKYWGLAFLSRNLNRPLLTGQVQVVWIKRHILWVAVPFYRLAFFNIVEFQSLYLVRIISWTTEQAAQLLALFCFLFS